MIKGCLFDLDGTLLDTLTTIRYYLNKTLSEYEIRNITEEETKIFVGKGAKNLVETAMKAGGIDLTKEENKKLSEKICDEYTKEYDKNPAYLTSPYTYIPELVKELKKQDLKLAVISNKPDFTVKQLVELNFPKTFDIVEGGSEKHPLKPDPEWPLAICEQLSLSPSEVMYIGDTSTDMKTAKNFGAGVAVGVLWGFRGKDELVSNGADVIVESPLEILNLLKN